MKPASVKTLYIDRAVADYSLSKSIRAKLAVPAVVVDDPRDVYETIRRAPDPVRAGKETLYLTRNKGTFLRDCPGTKTYRCCDYRILHFASFCTMDCAYCILQTYFHPPVMQYFVNHDDLFGELDRLFASPQFRRVGTGEFTDSLIWEGFSNLTTRLVEAFASQNNTVLELKTKTVNTMRLRGLPHNRKTIMSWSLNTEKVIKRDERGTASLSARLEAAKKAASWGYPLAFHFDPIVIYEGCIDEYRRVVSKLFSAVPPRNIVWISLGSFRFMPDLKPVVRKRFAGSKITLGEFIPGIDGKMRYFKPVRKSIYKAIVDAIRALAPDVTLYFCMEDDDIWEHTLGFKPEEKGGLPQILDNSVITHCDLA